MASSTANVFAAQPVAAGTLHRAPLGTALPESARTALNVAFVDQGYIGEDGFTQTEDQSSDKKYAFGGDLVKVVYKEFSATVKFTFLESQNAEVLKSIYGEDNVTVGTAEDSEEIVVKKNKVPKPHASWVIDVLDDDALERSVIPDGQISNVADIKKVSSDLISYTVTLECFPDEDGNNVIEYKAKGEAVDPTP